MNWITLIGNAAGKGSIIEYHGGIIEEGPSKGQVLNALIKSSEWFEAGSIKFDITVEHPSMIAQVILNHGYPDQVFIGLAGGSFSINLFANGKIDILASSGNLQTIPDSFEIEVRVLGSQINLFVNHVHVCAANYNIRKCQPAFFLSGAKKFSATNVKVGSIPSTAFVVMQYTDEFNELYNEVIKPTVESFDDMKCIRADDIYTNGQILDDISQSIIEASFIIADITPDNPNVYYEVGFAHAIKKPVILLSDDQRGRLPFDISGFRVIIYNNSIGGKSKVEERLRKHVEAILNC